MEIKIPVTLLPMAMSFISYLKPHPGRHLRMDFMQSTSLEQTVTLFIAVYVAHANFSAHEPIFR